MMNEYKRGFELFKSGYLTEDPAFLLRSFHAALNYKASADSSEKKTIWKKNRGLLPRRVAWSTLSRYLAIAI